MGSGEGGSVVIVIEQVGTGLSPGVAPEPPRTLLLLVPASEGATTWIDTSSFSEPVSTTATS